MLFSLKQTCSAQGKIELNAGVGFYEALSIKAKLGRNVQVGICQGFVGKYIFHSALELYYHPAHKSDPGKRARYYLMGGIGSTFLSTAYQNHMTTFYPRIGWTIPFGERTGLNLDAGPCLSRIRDTDNSYYAMLVPSGSIHFYVKLLK